MLQLPLLEGSRLRQFLIGESMSTLDKESESPTQMPEQSESGVKPRVLSQTQGYLQEIYKIAFLLLVLFVARSSLFGIYVIPTGSMLPTIKIDDRVFANKLAYGLMLPWTESQFFSWAKPQRGEIVLFKSPLEDNTFVKRVAGIEGDRISFLNGILSINGKPLAEVEQKDRSIMDDMGGENGSDKILFLESGLGSEPHYMLRMAEGGRTFFEKREFVVPPGKIFCLGDNRDGSNDSREWGMVEAQRVYGRASFVFFSTVRHDAFYPKFRSDRFFRALL